ALIVALLLVSSGCDGPASPSPAPADGAIAVRGTERLAWSQAGYVSGLRFIAYVDDIPVLLGAAACEDAEPEARCSSPMPPMADGIHAIALAAMLGTGLQSGRSESILLQKTSDDVASLASLPDATFRAAAVRLQTAIQIAADLAFDADVIARGVRAPAQMATTPDGRLLIAESG